jgi:hypothetical protein
MAIATVATKATRERTEGRTSEIEAIQAKIDELKPPAVEALEDVLASAQSFVDAYAKYQAVWHTGQAMRPGTHPRPMGLPVDQEAWLDRLKQEMEAVTLTELRLPIPTLEGVVG